MVITLKFDTSYARANRNAPLFCLNSKGWIILGTVRLLGERKRPFVLFTSRHVSIMLSAQTHPMHQTNPSSNTANCQIIETPRARSTIEKVVVIIAAECQVAMSYGNIFHGPTIVSSTTTNNDDDENNDGKLLEEQGDNDKEQGTKKKKKR
eukprot:CAMPEP_0172331586 /NCGR_PEP_ID=MMETSP1058-20130122/62004_1 /TAXON_ID=83371 /ORGANISM="Detonula confervacea, Strain CCMP 353" /LENGTH=150 /DNA_ID=CAMNT_0013048855 /DNA_START=192 /DNA_END=645 /DNA_ORIENTATION=+